MGKLSVGMIGTGFITPAHVEAVRRLGCAEVTAIAGSNLEAARAKADALGIPNAYGDYRELLENAEISVVHNCTPNYLHYQINKEIIESGKHVLSEKPMAMSRYQTKELLDLAREHRVHHAINFNYRQYPLVQHMKCLIKKGTLGDVKLVHGAYLQDWLCFESDYNWRVDPAKGGVTRAISDIGSHWLDTVQHVIGKRITAVFADLVTVVPVRKKPLEAGQTFTKQGDSAGDFQEVRITTEDYGAVLLRFDGTIPGVTTVSQVSPGRKNHLTFSIDCSQSSVCWNQEEPEKLWIGHRDRANEMLLADSTLLVPDARDYSHYPGGHNEGWPDGMKNMMHQFYSAILEDRDLASDEVSFATFQDGHDIECVIEAIHESHQSGQWVQVSYDD